MKTIPVEVRDGLLRLPKGIEVPAANHLAILVLDGPLREISTHEIADKGGAFQYLQDEPDLYSDGDVLPGRRNPTFGQS